MLSSIDELQDVESKNAYQFYVNAGEVSPEEMLKYVNCAGRDNSRTPMQWNTEENAGFTHGTPWLRINPNLYVSECRGIRPGVQILSLLFISSCWHFESLHRQFYEAATG